jgi:Laminin G domain
MTPKEVHPVSRKVLEPTQVLPSLSMRPSFWGFRRWALVLTVLLAASAAAAAEPASARWTTSARWEMNEGVNASTMRDASAADRDGSIGDVVLTGVVTDGGDTVYEWPPGDLSVENPERLVTVPSSGLNPRRADYSVRVRFKTTEPDQNIIQKGQATAAAQWKLELVNGRAKCLFKGSGGRGAIGSGVSLADGNWHTVRCMRVGGIVKIVVGGQTRSIDRNTGRIANQAQVTIGGKFNCNPANNVSCQYYVGQIDRAVIKRRSR